MFSRCTALVLSVNNVVLLVKSASICTDPPGWMDQAMLEVEEHLKVLMPFQLFLATFKSLYLIPVMYDPLGVNPSTLLSSCYHSFSNIFNRLIEHKYRF